MIGFNVYSEHKKGNATKKISPLCLVPSTFWHVRHLDVTLVPEILGRPTLPSESLTVPFSGRFWSISSSHARQTITG